MTHPWTDLFAESLSGRARRRTSGKSYRAIEESLGRFGDHRYPSTSFELISTLVAGVDSLPVEWHERAAVVRLGDEDPPVLLLFPTVNIDNDLDAKDLEMYVVAPCRWCGELTPVDPPLPTDLSGHALRSSAGGVLGIAVPVTAHLCSRLLPDIPRA